jgi:hypothetical protein
MPRSSRDVFFHQTHCQKSDMVRLASPRVRLQAVAQVGDFPQLGELAHRGEY